MSETSHGVGADVAFPALARELAYCSLWGLFYAEKCDSSKGQETGDKPKSGSQLENRSVMTCHCNYGTESSILIRRPPLFDHQIAYFFHALKIAVRRNDDESMSFCSGGYPQVIFVGDAWVSLQKSAAVISIQEIHF